MREFAILEDNGAVRIVDVVTTCCIERAKAVADKMLFSERYTVKPLDQVPDSVKEKYRFWGERP